MGEEITSVIANAGEDWAQDDKSVAQRDKLLRMRDRETKAVADLATKLRLTNQSRYVPHAQAELVPKRQRFHFEPGRLPVRRRQRLRARHQE